MLVEQREYFHTERIGGAMVKGIGIDSVDIEEMRGICGDFANAFVRRTFTEAEVAQALDRPDPASFLAGRFAVKEATFKALGHLTSEGGFDFRFVETLHDENGCPRITKSPKLEALLAEAGASEALVSITNESGLATAIVLVQ